MSIFKEIENLKAKLLDLTRRNRLLNYKYSDKSIRLIDEIPNQIMKELLNGASFEFIPVKEPTGAELLKHGYDVESKEYKHPTAREWASKTGLKVAYELEYTKDIESKEDKHTDHKLQTLFWEESLSAILRKVKSMSETNLENSGVHTLHLNFGFLKWFESKDSEKSSLAPLISVPVKLEKKISKNSMVYSISLLSDEIILNQTLSKKLLNDFNLILPNFEEDLIPEQYLKKVESLVQNKPRWLVQNEVVLAAFNFKKQIMYEDLNEEHIPKDNLLRKIFSSEESKKEVYTSGSETFDLSTLDKVHEKYPLVYDADSSQHSAVIDAVEGKNLVVEGPPGSGKSQTITNLIAAAIASGKSVLFVSEKMVALEVVKKRLVKVGLGDFCLELHSHKANKKLVVSDLAQSISNRNYHLKPTDISVNIKNLNAVEDDLKEYVSFVNTVWGETNLTPHKIFSKAVRYREEFSLLDPSLVHEDLFDKISFSTTEQNSLSRRFRIFFTVFKEVSKQVSGGNIVNHYWYGIHRCEFTSYQTRQLEKSLDSWSNLLENVYLDIQRLRISLGLDSSGLLLKGVEFSAQELSKLPELKGGELLSELTSVFRLKEDFFNFCDEYKKIHEEFDSLKDTFKEELIVDKSKALLLEESLQNTKDIGVTENLALDKISEDIESLSQVSKNIEEVEIFFSKLDGVLPSNLFKIFSSFFSKNKIKNVLKIAELFKEIPKEFWANRRSIYEDDNLDDLIKNFEFQRKKIDKYCQVKKIFKEEFFKSQVEREVVSLQNLKFILRDGGFFKYFSFSWWSARKKILSITQTGVKFKKSFLALEDLISYVKEVIELQRIHSRNPILGSLFQGVDTDLATIFKYRKIYKNIRAKYSSKFDDTYLVGDDLLLNTDTKTITELSSDFNREVGDKVKNIMHSLKSFSLDYPSVDFFNNKDIFLKQLKTENSILKKYVQNGKLTCKSLQEGFVQLKQLSERVTKWEGSIFFSVSKKFISKLSSKPFAYSSDAYQALTNTLKIAKIFLQHEKLFKLSDFVLDAKSYSLIKEGILIVKDSVDRAVIEKNQFIEAGGIINIDEWYEASKGSVKGIIQKNKEALSKIEWLGNWSEYIKSKGRLSESGFAKVMQIMHRENISLNNLEAFAFSVIYNQLSKQIQAEPFFKKFNGLEHHGIVEEFKKIDRALKTEQSKEVAFKAAQGDLQTGVASGPVGNYTEVALIHHEAGKSKRHVAIRSLLSRAKNSIKSLKPCFMMSPMSVAQYLKPGKFEFDILVMDEASQIRPEDAVGSISRVKTVVIVGDPKQLPPTSFFDKMDDEEVLDENNALDEAESILDAVSPILHNRKLSWHYRSKHESLIQFSNKSFYNSRLTLFPSVNNQSKSLGIKFSYVELGRLEASRNVKEAARVVEIIRQYLQEDTRFSIGVVAMNIKQQEEINKQFEQACRGDKELLELVNKNKEITDNLFIKNLESVQGDERDIIIISMTYGPETVKGRVAQRFGPINGKDGWRRLNVLFTRAKNCMHIISTMRFSDIIADESSSRGVSSLRSFLQYAEEGRLTTEVYTGKSPDSDFEVSVIKRLKDAGYDSVPQLGVSGYFLDIAVRDPGNPANFLMAVECDGATYHSAKSRRDADRLRQEILEKQGWEVRRIWSTDWFANPEVALSSILRQLEQLKTVAPVIKTVTPVIEKIKIIENKNAVSSKLDDNFEGNLEEQLRHLSLAIRKKFPKTEEGRRLLRPKLLHAFLEHKPCSRSEFLEDIHYYLRNSIDALEGKQYLNKVFDLIAKYKE